MLVTHFDKNFYEWGKYYLISINKYNPELQVYISGVNLKKNQIEELMRIHPKTYIKNHIIEFNGIQKRCDGGGKDAEWKIMMQCRVSKVILEAIKYAKENNIKMFYVTDSDMMLNKNINNIFNELSKYDIIILNGSRAHLSRGEILNGVIGININEKSIDFCKEYDKMHLNRKPKWYDDQRYLLFAYNKFKDIINIGRISKNLYCDGTFQENSFIWSGHKEKKETNLKFFSNKLVNDE
tara:strand:- start:6479 stop:7192 length:714 start_codon:yes stop_codon:yes gene_type:complete